MLDRPVLVPLDGSDLSEKALPYAVSIARATNQPLVLMTVWEGVERELGSTPVATASAVHARGRALRQAYLDDVAQRVAAQRIETGKKLSEGRAAEELLWYCDQHPPGLLVMATHGRSGIQRMWYGSVATKLMRMAPVPTVLVGPGALEDRKEPAAIRSILVPLGGSPLGESALEPAATLAEALGARLILARAARLPAQALAPDLSELYAEGMDQAVTGAADEYLGRVQEGVKTTRPVETRVLRGYPAEAILSFVDQEKIDLVVMASHARSGMTRWALGSVADRVIQGAAPVLLIRPEVLTALTRSEEMRGRHCHTCGRVVAFVEVRHDDRCVRCRQHLHVCANCVYWDSLACLLRRSEAHDANPGVTCPRFQFIETVETKARAAVGAKE